MQPIKKEAKKTWGDENDISKLKKKVDRVTKQTTSDLQSTLQQAIQLKQQQPNHKKGEPIFIPNRPVSHSSSPVFIQKTSSSSYETKPL